MIYRHMNALELRGTVWGVIKYTNALRQLAMQILGWRVRLAPRGEGQGAGTGSVVKDGRFGEPSGIPLRREYRIWVPGDTRNASALWAFGWSPSRVHRSFLFTSKIVTSEITFAHCPSSFPRCPSPLLTHVPHTRAWCLVVWLRSHQVREIPECPTVGSPRRLACPGALGASRWPHDAASH